MPKATFWVLGKAIHFNLDNAWPTGAIPFRTLDVTSWGPELRFSASSRSIEEFYREVQKEVAPFVLYGSGDFHHLTALWVRQVPGPFVIVSFDNHPDWDIRPPRWCCGGWVNRALELPAVRKICVWGCGNFKSWWPGGRLFGNRRAEREGRLEIDRRGAIVGANWRERFAAFVRALGASDLYVTIDLDCLRAEDAITNWESGSFALEDLAWALAQLRASRAIIVGGDICGAFSPPSYARRGQRFIAEMDHPRLPVRDLETPRKINLRTFEALWPLLAG
ncbi:MAG TPA: hypothetical protein VNP98_00245 [Chthoniobacterales bacterium]|nr:hypothetical protein [Chthoniobacterales bacterium]